MVSDDNPTDNLEKYDTEEQMAEAKRQAADHLVEARESLRRAVQELAGQGAAPGVTNLLHPALCEGVGEVREDVDELRAALNICRVGDYGNPKLEEEREKYADSEE